MLILYQCKLTALIKCFEFLDATLMQKFSRFVYFVVYSLMKIFVLKLSRINTVYVVYLAVILIWRLGDLLSVRQILITPNEYSFIAITLYWGRSRIQDGGAQLYYCEHAW